MGYEVYKPITICFLAFFAEIFIFTYPIGYFPPKIKICKLAGNA
jgi:hypothetical protein